MKTQEHKDKQEQELETKALNQITKSPSITVDYDAYAHLLENSEMDEEQKRQFVQALWSVIYNFASLGFDAHPVQQIESKQCGQVDKQLQNSTSEGLNEVQFNNINPILNSSWLRRNCMRGFCV